MYVHLRLVKMVAPANLLGQLSPVSVALDFRVVAVKQVQFIETITMLLQLHTDPVSDERFQNIFILHKLNVSSNNNGIVTRFFGALSDAFIYVKY